MCKVQVLNLNDNYYNVYLVWLFTFHILGQLTQLVVPFINKNMKLIMLSSIVVNRIVFLDRESLKRKIKRFTRVLT
jgi:hypothetical protein